MHDTLLDIQVTAQRVQRFASDVEHVGTAESRELWRAALDDLRDAIRQARAAGLDSKEIHEAALGVDPGHFARPADGAADAAREAVAPDAAG